MKAGRELQKRTPHNHRPLLTAATTTHRHTHEGVLEERSRTVIDDSGSLAITAWTCAACGALVEELLLLSRERTAARPTMRYRIVPQRVVMKGAQSMSTGH